MHANFIKFNNKWLFKNTFDIVNLVGMYTRPVSKKTNTRLHVQKFILTNLK